MSTLTASVLAAVRGRKKASRLEEDREPVEDLEEEEKEAENEDDKSAEEEDRDPDAEDEEDNPAAENKETDPDAEEEEDGKHASREAKIRRAEQARIRAILTHPKADANPGLAAELAFGARYYSAKAAAALLAHAGTGTGSLASRMAGRSPRIGSGGAPAPAGERQALVANVKQTIEALHGRKPASR